MSKHKERLKALNAAIFIASNTSSNCSQARNKFNLFFSKINKKEGNKNFIESIKKK